MRNPSGIIPALSTPTNGRGELDEEGLRSLVARNVGWGVQGVAVSIVAGEFFKFSDEERRKSFDVVIDEANEHVPVWAGVNHIGTLPSIELAKYAKNAGAYGVITMPPLVGTRTDAAMHEHFSALLDAVDIPVMIQDAEDFTGVHMRTNLYSQLKMEHSNLASIKVEGGDTLKKMEDILCVKELRKLTVLGGMSGKFILQEVKLGTHGTIPASCLTDFLIEIYKNCTAGRDASAKKLFGKYKPWLDFVALNSASSAEVQKETSRLRGIIKSSHTRSPHVPLGSAAKRELAALVDKLCSDGR
jgi:dihydrodipicolinate synthase/N-acetylneuraminate lyase